jgi:hypothetical protein
MYQRINRLPVRVKGQEKQRTTAEVDVVEPDDCEGLRDDGLLGRLPLLLPALTTAADTSSRPSTATVVAFIVLWDGLRPHYSPATFTARSAASLRDDLSCMWCSRQCGGGVGRLRPAEVTADQGLCEASEAVVGQNWSTACACNAARALDTQESF